MNAIQHLDAFLEIVLPQKMSSPDREVEIKMSMQGIYNLDREIRDYVIEYGFTTIGQPIKGLDEGFTMKSPRGTITITHNGK